MSLEEAPSYEEDESPRDKLISIEAEQMVLGCILMNNEAFHTIDGDLSAEDFSEPLHQRIFTHCAKLIEKGQTADPLTLGNYFENDPAIKQIGHGYIAKLAAWATSPRLIGDYAKHMRQLSVRRGLFDQGQEIIKASLNADVDTKPETLVEQFMEGCDGLLSKRSKDDASDIRDGLRDACEGIQAAFKRKGEVIGLATGLRDLDAHLGGLEDSCLYIIAGRPGMGKSALAGSIAINMAKAGKRGVFFSLEMSRRELSQRFIASETRLSMKAMREGKISDNEWRRITAAGQALAEIPLKIDDTGGLTIRELASRARRHKRRGGLDFVVVDYLQLMSGSGTRRGDNRTNEITEITMGLKALAKDLSVPVIALSQLSRAVEQRANKRPLMSDLRESGSIEQDADVILFVYREHYYIKDEGVPKKEADRADYFTALNRSAGRAEVIVAKFRNGPTGHVDLAFEDETTTFRDMKHGV